ncbi:hypothetical protein LPUS_09585 [Lasallia pustulata]|uniref:Reverse transcriptase domain-containing protein n=1 Tax=Lasallia pustulata TaxID=136370 RepID=A0A1W5D7P4_9LECA|nr:hypothetical protein LPUS_09585 [Lasallia pustulata]
MGMDITLPLGQWLNESPQLRRDMAYNLQSSAPHYRVKKSTKAVPVAALAAPNQSNKATAPTVTSVALPDDGEATPMFCTSWLGELKAGRALINTGSIVDIMSERMLSKLPDQQVHTDGHLNINLADDNKCTLHNYTWLTVNVSGVEAMIQAYILPVTAYDLLLGLKWQRQSQAPGLVITGLIRGERVDHSDEPIQNGEQEDHETEDDSHKTSQLVAMATYTEAKPYSGHIKEAKNVLAAKAIIQTQANDGKAVPFSLQTIGRFPTSRRPTKRTLTDESEGIVNDWFKHSGITIGPKAETPTQQSQVKRLLYTWKDCFAVTVREIQPTDLIEHSIDLLPYSKPVRSKLPRYTPREREFSNRIFPELEEAGIVARMSSNWAARTKFPPKKKGSDQLRVVHNFIPVNKCTIKSEYPMHRLEEVLDILIKPRFSCYFSTDVSNSYWVVPIKAGDEYKAGIITPHGQYAYRRMGQGLKGAPHTYSQFTDLVFGPIPRNDVSGEPRMDTIIDDHGNTAMALFMDDYAASATDFDSLYNFLADFFFPRAVFGPIYLNPKKTVVFGINLDLLGFTGRASTIRPSIKHRDKVMNWPIPTNREELDAFVYLTPFLRNFIAGGASHVLILKKAYLEQVPAEPVKPKNRPEIEACDEDLTKPARGERYRPYQTI